MNNSFNFNEYTGLLGLGLGILVFLLIIFFTILIFYIVGKWKLYEKAGREGWKSIIPFYNDWIYVEMAGLNSWYFLLLIANTISITFNLDDNITIGNGTFGLITLVGMFFCNYNISKKLHRDTLFAVLMTLFPFILIPIIGFSDKYIWDDSISVSANGPIDEVNKNNKANDGDNMQNYKFCSYCGAKIEKTSKYCSHCGKEI
ncbi:MAG: zinc ribbon domain-containing protein [Bacilli bacterium]|nr:zinc ribbon domain-containing protein [Bacilli bacterium]